MQELLETVKQVRERIEKHGDKLRQNEMLTRYTLIDPILRALDWNTEDPEQVVPEFSTEVGRPDYVLRCGGQLIGVEAKKLGATDSDFENARKKALPLYQEKGIRFYVITDGDRWVIWDISKPKDEMPHPIIDVRLSDKNCGNVARKLLALWRPAVPEVEVAPEPIMGKLVLVEEETKGISLIELQRYNVIGQKLSGRLRFPDKSTSRKISKWYELLVEVARWALPNLQKQKKLPLGTLICKDSNSMRTPKKLEDGWFVKTHFNAEACIRNAIRILKEIDIEPSTVLIEGWQPSEQRKRKR